MSAFLSSIAATIITIPFIAYIIFFIICKQITKKHKKSVHLAMDGSALFFIISVHFLVTTILGESFLWLILLTMITIGILVVVVHWKIKKEIDYRRVFQSFLRLNFLFFFVAYVFLLLIGIIGSIISAIS